MEYHAGFKKNEVALDVQNIIKRKKRKGKKSAQYDFFYIIKKVYYIHSYL